MKNRFSRIFSIAIAAFVSVMGAYAQSDAISAAAGDKYLISAKAGGVNFVSGSVSVMRESGRSGHLLKGDRLEIGDVVSTGADGKAEILLNPGSYLRLGSSSSFRFKTTTLDDLQVGIESGSAMFEVFATEDFVVTVSTPKSKFLLVESGVYRIDVEAGGEGKVAVWKGKAQLGDETLAIVKSGREGELNGAQASIVKFDRGDKDELETWSKDRAKELAKITGSLQRNNMRTALMRSFLGRQWNMYSSFGLWVYDPLRRTNCFLPFGMGWGSPYGYGFGSNIWYYNLPGVIFYPPNNGGNGSNGPIRQILTSKSIRAQGGDQVDQIRPPFAQVQGSSGATGRDVLTTKTHQNGSFDMSSPDTVRSSGGFIGGGNSGAGAAASQPTILTSKTSRP